MHVYMQNSRKQVILKIILFTLIGALLGLAITWVTGGKAHAVPIEENGYYYSSVSSATQGVNKFNNGYLGRASGVTYTAGTKTKILSALKRTYLRQHPYGTFNSSAWWDNYTSHDSCAYTWKPSGGTAPDYWTCKNAAGKTYDWTPFEVRGYICSGVAGAAIIGTSGWALIGVGAGWAACIWSPMLQQAAN